MIVLGIDPGLANAGYGVVTRRRGRLAALDGGVIDTPAGLALEARLATVHRRVLELIDEHACTAMALEQLYFGQNVQTAFAVGHARGVTMLAGGQRGLPCFSYTPQRVKSAVCGNGRAAKDQVARMVQTLLELPALPRPDHASDALAVAICHCNGAPLAGALAAAQQPREPPSAGEPAVGVSMFVERAGARARARVPAPGAVGVPR
ncbi:MAG TPA: crossover junction endodeoxyribonuclease RuvC [Solirubrobacteraceae bacterium]|jgi:crossover junction endodeoxyribonuclease RuvC|nr:crossover junction endodeoxyribonuclease RuvC [Solirubrobacteraceae bacterium]